VAPLRARGLGRYNRTQAGRRARPRVPSRPTARLHTLPTAVRVLVGTQSIGGIGAGAGGSRGGCPAIQPPSYWSVASSAAPPALGGAHGGCHACAVRGSAILHCEPSRVFFAGDVIRHPLPSLPVVVPVARSASRAVRPHWVFVVQPRVQYATRWCGSPCEGRGGHKWQRLLDPEPE